MESQNILKPVAPKEAFELDLQPVKSSKIKEEEVEQVDNELHNTVDLSQEPQFEPKPFIVANTQNTTLRELKHDCIIPVFSKDNEKTLAHQEFIEITQNCVAKASPHHSLMLQK